MRATGGWRGWPRVFVAAALAQSNLLLRLKKAADAEEVCRLAVASDPESADAQYNLGNLLRRRGQLMNAAGHFRRAIDLAPMISSDACTNLAAMLSGLGHESDALAVLLKGAEYALDSFDTWHAG